MLRVISALTRSDVILNMARTMANEQLIPALRKGGRVVVDLTGARGLAPSFLEEAFGGLVRAGFTKEDLASRLEVTSSVDPSLVREVEGYIAQAARRAQAVH